MRALWLALIIPLLAACGGGGGGGGGGGATVSIIGRVITVSTGAAPSPPASVRAGSTSTTTNSVDGSFSLQATAGTSSVTVTFTPTSGAPIIFEFFFPPATGSVNLGDLYIGPDKVDVVGRVVSTADGSAVAGAQASLAGRGDTTDATGAFVLQDVAYDPNSLAVFFGLQGQVTASGFFTAFFSPSSAASGGIVDVGTIAITPTGSDDPPPPPFNIQGSVLPSADGAFALVELLSGSTVIRTTTADAAGRFTFWAPEGTYTVRATQGAKTGTAPVQVTDVNVIVDVDVTVN